MFNILSHMDLSDYFESPVFFSIENYALNTLLPFQLNDNHYIICPALYVAYNKLYNEAFETLTNPLFVDILECDTSEEITMKYFVAFQKRIKTTNIIEIQKQMNVLRDLFVIVNKTYMFDEMMLKN